MFEITPEVCERFPEHVTACYGPVRVQQANLSTMTQELLTEAKRDFVIAESTQPARSIEKWMKVFAKMGASPKYEPSIAGLYTRFIEKGTLYEINPVVDLYNSISLRWLTPMAGYDASHFALPLNLRFARKGEPFIPLGNPKQTEKTKNGEVVYADVEKVICRYWNYRDCHETRLTSETEEVVFFADILEDTPDQANSVALGIQAKLSEALGTIPVSVTCHSEG